jgi:hypothetical protein
MVLAREIVRTALNIYGRAPVPAPRGAIRGGSPADPKNIFETAGELP